jgi:RNA polymerase sigma-70 factor, ECF subfamily
LDAEALYRKSREGMLAWARRCLRSDADAQDVVSESFARLLKARARSPLRSEEPMVLRAYLFRTLRNCISTPRRTPVPLEDDMLVVPAEPEPLPASERTSLADLQEAISRLPASLRTPLLLAFFEGMPHREIAQRMSITTGAVALRIHKAKRRLERQLRGLLAEREDEPPLPTRAARQLEPVASRP